MHGTLPAVVPVGTAPLIEFLRAAPLQGVERSFKLAPGQLIGERLLAGISLAVVDTAWLSAVCRAIGFPDAERAAFERHALQADIVHFGYEAGPDGLLFKVYLEYARRIDSATGPVLLHLAWKWSPADPGRQAIARYRYLPGVNAAAIGERIGRLCDARGAALLMDVAALAAARSPEPLMYLEVVEDGNPRASFDLNVHPSGLHLRDVEPQLRGLLSYFRVPPAAFDGFYGGAREACLGHVSGGRSRSGAAFATFYLDGAGAAHE